MKRFFSKLAILLLNVFVVASGATAATVPLMTKSFSNVSPTMIELLMTVPALGIIIFTPLSNFIVDRIGVKKDILLGLLIILISGVTPALTTNFALIFISRIGIGVGTGMLASYALALIIALYQGQEQGQMMGLSSVVQGLGMFLMTYFAGSLMRYGWQASYWVNAFALFVFLLVLFFIPSSIDQKFAASQNSQSQVKTDKHVDGPVWLLAIFMFCFNATFAFITIRFASLVVAKGYGSVQDASTLLGIMSFAMAAGGFIFMALKGKIKHFSMAIALACGTLAFVILPLSNSLVLSGLAVVLVGIAVSMSMVSMGSYVGDFTSPCRVPFSTSVAMSAANIGTLVSPYIAQAVSKIFGSSSPATTFVFGAFVFAILLVVAILIGTNYGKFSQGAKAKKVNSTNHLEGQNA